MAAKLIGQVGEFVEGQEEWSQYAERIDHYFVANDVDGAEKKRAMFLSLIGPRCYKLLASLVAPAKPGEKALEELVASLKKHYDPQPSEILQGESNAVQPTLSEQVHQVHGGESRKGQEPCYRCGGTNHVPSQCRFIGKQCFNCGKPGHTARMCGSKKSNSAQQQNARNPVRVVQMESPEYEEYSLNQVTTAAEKCFHRSHWK